MAEATKHDEVTEVVTPAHVILTLTIAEARAIRTLGQRVGGMPAERGEEPTPRDSVDSVMDALATAGVKPLPEDYSNGSIYLADNEGGFPGYYAKDHNLRVSRIG